MEGKIKRYCKFPGCETVYRMNRENKHFFSFPKDPQTHQLWKDTCNIKGSIDASRFRLCEDHFLENDFMNKNRNRLKPGTVPFVVQCSESVEVETVETTTVDTVETDNFACFCYKPSTSSTVCCTNDYSYSQNPSEIICNTHLDHDYFAENSLEVPERCDKFAFLRKGVLAEVGLSKKELTPRKQTMYKIHRNTLSKLSKLKSLLENEREKVKVIHDLYQQDRFEFIEENLNFITKEFINSQLRNSDKAPHARRWSEQDKAFALSIYKKSPRLYRYLASYFQLPSIRCLKAILAKIPFETGLSPAIVEHLGNEVHKMKPANRVCGLVFDEMMLSDGLQYQEFLQKISGFEDLGLLGRSEKHANHALVFMLRGLRKQWKQVVAYYFTANTISADNLKVIIKDIIGELQALGLDVVATTCDQGPTNQSALTKLCSEPHDRQSPFYFFVNDRPVVTIFDVPHLLKNTRNALLKCKLEFEPNKFAFFKYIEDVFNFDQKRSFKALPKLRSHHFNFKDSYVKMKVKVAAAQLSSSVASAIETYSVLTEQLPNEALQTAEFVKLIDDLFDSLNSTQPRASHSKPFRCALREGAPHWELWSKLLTSMNHWKLIDLESGADCTNRYSFIRGWQTTIRSVMFLWHRLKVIPGFEYLNTRSLNQDPLENLFSSIRQHGAFNTNPTCHQFTAALKTVVVNKLVAPTSEGNCEDDGCTPLENLRSLLRYATETPNPSQDPVDEDTSFPDQNEAGLSSDLDASVCFENLEKLSDADSQGVAYVAGYILKQIDVPECDVCQNALTAKEMSASHLLIYFKEGGDAMRLRYASERVIGLVQSIHENLYRFLDKHGHQHKLEDRFKALYKSTCGLGQEVCKEHDCFSKILDKCTRLVIHKYVRDRKKRKAMSDGHFKKMKRFKKSC